MGFFFTLLYILTAYLAPQTLFGPLAEYRIEVVIAVIAIASSVLTAQGSGLAKIPQSYAIVGLVASVVLSTIFAGLTGEAFKVMMDVTTSVITFYLIVINVRKVWQLKTLVIMLLGVGLFITLIGDYGLRTGNYESPYVLSMSLGGGDHLLRIRGLSFLNDPNDLSQFMVAMIPLAFLFWKKGRSFTNFVFVMTPVGILLYGMFLSHSRGGMIALVAAAVIAGRRRIGILPAAIAGGVMFLGLSAVGWGGGRDVSAASGMERMEAWSTGMQLIRSHPVFGVGYQRFNEFYYITAHNSVIVVAAELGLVGLFFWMLFVFPTLRDAVEGTGDKRRKAEKDALKDDFQTLPVRRLQPVESAVGGLAYAGGGAPAGLQPLYQRSGALTADATPLVRTGEAAGRSPQAQPLTLGMEEELEVIPLEELERMSGLVLISLSGFFAAGWFLSRSYTMALYVNMGIAAVVYKMARDRNAAPEPMAFGRASWLSAVTSLILVIIVYVIVRVEHLLPH